ncbi:EamA/RhaT family transporter [Deinococcus cavernae]|uniref:EamA/RhaT family transporter n=1 Tax=Deinococcus cavernae TaxID=2320857 RepID=A0A418V5F9_9DEIO|nr:EamA family transporter [Deinococcus cavernae]RJF71255.1 EamA/RhaT family transporter [Deinococcus cavernae]
MTRRDYFDLFLLSAFWGISFLLIKFAGHDFPPVWVALLRSLFGMMILGLAMWWQKVPFPPRPLWPMLTLIALLNNAFPWLMFALGEQSVSSNIASILNATTPLFTLLVAVGLGDSRPSRPMWLGVMIGLAGVALTVSGGMQGGQAALPGVLMILAAAFSYGLGGVIAKKNTAGLTPLSVAGTQLLLSTLLLLPFGLFGAHPAQVSLQSWGAVIVLGVVGSGLAYLVFYNLLARVSPTQTTAVTYILPIWGLFWGALAGEHVGAASLLGVAVVLSGVYLMNRRPVLPAGPLERAAR